MFVSFPFCFNVVLIWGCFVCIHIYEIDIMCLCGCVLFRVVLCVYYVCVVVCVLFVCVVLGSCCLSLCASCVRFGILLFVADTRLFLLRARRCC